MIFNKQLALSIADALAESGYIIVDDIIDKNLVEDLYQRVLSLEDLTPAQIGRGNNRQNITSIRSDRTHWLEGKEHCEDRYLTWMRALQESMNEALYLGIYEYEAHFAHYQKDAFYQKHFDVLKGNNSRLLTTVFYLNNCEGGELVIYDEETIIEKVTPIQGRMVIFLSDKFPHEVLPAHSDRYSIAGWFKGRTV